MSALETLLVLQEHDLTADQLVHRRRSLPELAELAAIERRLVELERARAQVASARAEVTRRLAAREDELATLEARIVRDEERLYGGSVSVARELSALQTEVDSLRSRQSVLEDKVLEAMTELEPLDAQEQELLSHRARLDAEGARLRAAVAEAQSGIDQELAHTRARRAEASGRLSGDLSALYEKARAAHGGVGVAVLSAGRCGGCHLGLPKVEVERLHRLPPDQIAYCDHCGRILVRT